MDTLKLAFDTLIVGVLALPWLAIVLRKFVGGSSPALKDHFAILSLMPENARQALASVFLVAIGYVLGSSISRVASDFFNDEFWHGTPLPTEDEIREAVYCEQDEAQMIDWKRWPQQATDFKNGEGLLCEKGKRVDEAKTITKLKPWEKMKRAFSNIFALQSTEPDARTKAQHAVLDTFRLQESAVLLSGEDKTDRLRQYSEQIVILRGGALNGIILCCICVFGWCANWRGCLRGLMRFVTWLPAGLVFSVGLSLMGVALFTPSSEHSYSDPPLAEAVLASVGLIGFVVPPADPDSRLYAHGFAVGLVLALILYGAWWWTEVLYNESVVHFFHVLSTGGAA